MCCLKFSVTGCVKNLANKILIQIPLKTSRKSEQVFGSCYADCLYQGIRWPVTQEIRGGRKMSIFNKLFDDNTHLLCVI